MAKVYTVRFGALARTAPGAIQVYVAPEGMTSVLRDLIIWNRDSIVATIGAWIQSPGGSAYLLCWSNTAEHDTAVTFQGRQVLLPDDSLFLYSSSSAWNGLATGYELTGP